MNINNYSSDTEISSSRMENSSTLTSPVVASSMQSSKEGKDFKYDEAGRRYNSNADVAYMLPNDDDGNKMTDILYKIVITVAK
jgi:hypothetical protein